MWDFFFTLFHHNKFDFAGEIMRRFLRFPRYTLLNLHKWGKDIFVPIVSKGKE